MKTLNQYIKEKLIINKDYHDTKIVVKSSDELRKIIEQRYEEYGPGTKRNPIDFNDIDVSNIDSFRDKLDLGIFNDMNFKYIDVSDWDVSNVTDMSGMFFMCKELKSVGDISKWNVSKVTDMNSMFDGCNELEFIGDISSWDVSNVTNMAYMFQGCNNFNQDISEWDVSNVTDMSFMFCWCESFNKDISKWNVYNVKHHLYAFDKCSIKEEYKPKFK